MRRRWFQFGLRWLPLIVVLAATAVAIPLHSLHLKRARAARERARIAQENREWFASKAEMHSLGAANAKQLEESLSALNGGESQRFFDDVRAIAHEHVVYHKLMEQKYAWAALHPLDLLPADPPEPPDFPPPSAVPVPREVGQTR